MKDAKKIHEMEEEKKKINKMQYHFQKAKM